MRVGEKIALGAAALVVVGLGALALPVIDSLGSDALPLPASDPSEAGAADAAMPAPTEAEPDGVLTAETGDSGAGGTHPNCETIARYDITTEPGEEWRWNITGSVVDTGASVGASGTPNPDLTRYTVAAGDTFGGIGDRFCIDHLMLGVINRDLAEVQGLQIGQTVRLYPEGDAADFVG